MRAMIVLLVFAALAAGCAKSQEVWFADGKHRGYLITCEGIEGGMSECFQKAADVCGKKNFDITHHGRRPPPELSLMIRCRAAT